VGRRPRIAAFAAWIAAAGAGCHPGLHGPVTPGMGGDPGWVLVSGVPIVRQTGPADCGAAALEMVVRYWRPEASVRAVLAPRPGEDGIEAARLRAVARDQGLSAFLVEGTVDDLVHEVELRRPVLVGLVRVSGRQALAHYVVVVGMNRNRQRVLTADPEHGWREVSLASFLGEWQPAHHLTLVAFPPQHADRR
jgi:ABC-type bacteriocin/lantibiotic exporter with double-glycine peptidase domain